MIQAVTFDFWDTIAIDDSDELKRAQMGLPSKAEARIQLFVDHMRRHYPHVPGEQVEEAYRVANERFRHDWHQEHRTPTVVQRIHFAYEALGLAPEPGHWARLIREVDELARDLETMEVRIAPDFAPGIQRMLDQLAGEYRLGIISDTIHTTGRGIRHLLYQQGLLPYFSFFVFSDEVGASKPSHKVFRHASQQVGLPPQLMLHIGDRESNDVDGPLALGMRAILYTGIIDRGSAYSRATAICRNYGALPELVRRMR
jgi:putative hydrolase of the HAD superfamily